MRELRLGRVSLLLVVAALAFPAVSEAAVTIGAPDVNVPPDNSLGCGGDYCTYVSAVDSTASYAAPFDGVIVRWRVRAGGGSLRLRVFEPVPSAPPPQYLLKATALPAVDRLAFAASDPAATQETRIPIEQGDLIGVTVFGGSIATDNPGPGTFVAHNNQSPNDDIVDGTYVFPNSNSGQRLLYNADIEPDADRDGYGDETQDLCPTDGTTNTACPAVVPRRRAVLRAIRSASGAKRLVVDVDCPESRTSPCKGSVFARSSKRLRLTGRRNALRVLLSFGEKSFSVAPGETEVLRFRLSRSERKVLVRLRRFGVTMTLVEEGFAPAKFRGTAKAPKRKRQRR